MRGASILKRITVFAVGLWFMHLLSSCGSTKELVYMQGSFDTAQLSQINAVEPVIRKGDILSIIVFSDNPGATQLFNQSLIAMSNSSDNGTSTGSTTTRSSGGSPSAPGYQVDENGAIIFQGIGLLHVEGLTKAQLKDTLNMRLTPFLKHPYYSIRFLNYKFTVLGEVGKPGQVSIPGERINLLEAVALAGDLTIYGRRDNVLVIRENNNKREFSRLDLTKPEIMKSPYFYLQQNDVVIVEPNKRKITANDAVTARNISLGLAFISTFAVLYSLFHNN